MGSFIEIELLFWRLISSFPVRETGTSITKNQLNQRGTMIGARGTVGCRGIQSHSLPARATEKCLGIHECPEASLFLKDSLCFSSTSLLASLAFSQSFVMIPSLTSPHTTADSLSLTSCKPETELRN